MELQVNGNVNVTVELGPQTLALLTGGMAAPAKPSKEAVAVLGEETAKKGAETIAKLEAEKKPAAPKAEAPKAPVKPKKDEPVPFEEMDDEAKLDTIKAEVTKHTKKGKSADIKFILSNFEAGRASELDPDNYAAFYNAIVRYGKGEDLADIFPGEEEDLG